jgi:hypothetical protein
MAKRLGNINECFLNALLSMAKGIGTGCDM